MRVFAWFIGLLRSAIRLLMTERERVGALEKLLRGALMTPLLGLMLVLLQLRAMLLGPMRVHAISADGDRFQCDLPDLIQLYIHVFGVWEPDLAAFMRSRLRAGDTVADVGANIGFDTMLASRAVGHAGRVVAIEAAPAVFDRLRETLQINGSPANVRAVNKAAGGPERGTLSVYAGPSHNIGLTTTVPRGRMPQTAQIEALPLSDLLEPDELARLRLIKIDVEGGEDAVLDGLRAGIDRLPRTAEIAIELSPMWWADRSRSAADVLQPYIESGFNVYTIANNYWPWRYLWPHHVQRPRRLRDAAALMRPMKRLDIVLSREDSEQL